MNIVVDRYVRGREERGNPKLVTQWEREKEGKKKQANPTISRFRAPATKCDGGGSE